jgi:hypothetical protein
LKPEKAHKTGPANDEEEIHRGAAQEEKGKGFHLSLDVSRRWYCFRYGVHAIIDVNSTHHSQAHTPCNKSQQARQVFKAEGEETK